MQGRNLLTMPSARSVSPDERYCEIKIGDVWRRISLVEATKGYRFKPMRCPSCHGEVSIGNIHRGPAHYRTVHRKTHEGCALKRGTFRGTASLHPHPLL